MGPPFVWHQNQPATRDDGRSSGRANLANSRLDRTTSAFCKLERQHSRHSIGFAPDDPVNVVVARTSPVNVAVIYLCSFYCAPQCRPVRAPVSMAARRESINSSIKLSLARHRRARSNLESRDAASERTSSLRRDFANSRAAPHKRRQMTSRRALYVRRRRRRRDILADRPPKSQ